MPPNPPPPSSFLFHALLIFAVSLLCATSILSVQATRSLARSIEWVAHSEDATRRVSNIWNLLGEAESYQRGYLLTGEPRYLDPYRRAKERFDAEFAGLATSTAEDGRQVARANELRRLVQVELGDLAELSRVRAARGLGAAAARLRAQGRDAAPRGARHVALEMLAQEQSLLAERQQRMRSELRDTNITIVIANGMALLAGVLGAVMLRRSRHAWERQRSAELEAERALRASREKSAFLASMSHEIRTPMNAIFGFSELLAGTVRGAREQQYLRTIMDSGKALLTLIDDILDLAKIESGRIDLKPVPTDLRDLVDCTLALFTQLAADKQVALRAEIDPTLPDAVRLDPVRVRQVLFNLIGNAVKYTDRGNVTVRVGAQRSALLPDEVALQIAVEDTGAGIARDRFEQIFEPFVQGGGGSVAPRPGTGLGLSIVKRLAELMHGSVAVDSELGRGSRFTLSLDHVAVAQRPAPAPGEVDIDFDRMQRCRILVVDDVAWNRDLIAAYLANSHHEVHLAADGPSALELAQQHPPDLVLLDLRMPGMDGREVLARLRAEPRLASLRVVAVTASSLASEEDSLRREFDGYLSKPFSRAQLHAELRRLMPECEARAHAHAPQDVAEAVTAEEPAAATIEAAGARIAALATTWPRLRDSLAMRETRAFAVQLVELAGAARAGSLGDYGRRLLGAVDRFDLTTVESLLHRFPVELRESGIVAPLDVQPG